jgi:exopolysaccharide/PEP-CTERM locus tyrosine autokinase
MSLIERAVDKLAAAPVDAASLPERAMALAKAQAAKAAEGKAIDASPSIMAAGARFAPPPATAPASTPAQAQNAAPTVAPVATPAAAPISTPRANALSDARVAPRPAPAPGNARKQSRIHIEALRARGFVTPDGAPTEIGQQFRMIKRPLLVNAFGSGSATAVKNGRRVMVTSAFAGEGKSFCAINLAMSIAAERDTHVLLVDADVARPSLPRELGIESSRGLMDWLTDTTLDIGELVQPTNVDKLSILTAGRHHEQATEFLSSESMGQLLDHLSDRYVDRIIIFDTPPLLITTEARVLAAYMGQIVMVVEAGRTSREAVKDALASIGSPEVVGMVLNKSRESRAVGYQGYGYAAN